MEQLFIRASRCTSRNLWSLTRVNLVFGRLSTALCFIVFIRSDRITEEPDASAKWSIWLGIRSQTQPLPRVFSLASLSFFFACVKQPYMWRARPLTILRRIHSHAMVTPEVLLLTTWTMSSPGTNQKILSLPYPKEMCDHRFALSWTPKSNLNLVSTSSMVVLT